MLVVDLMTKNVITVTENAPVLDALKLMQQHGFRRLPVVDEDGHPVGVVSQTSIEKIKPQSGIPMIWQSGPWAVRHTVGEVMNKKIVTVKPTDTVEVATSKAQNSKVGSLLVVEDGKLVGMVTTNDIFYRIVNPTLGIGESGSRIVVPGGGGQKAASILAAVNQMGVQIKIIWAVYSPTNKQNNLVLHLETEDARNVVGELSQMGYAPRIMPR
jgi:acetoin utilization protein AcuB